MIHCNMLGKSMTDPVFSFTRKTCVAASKTILKMLQQPFDEDRPILWIEQAFTVTASEVPYLLLSNLTSHSNCRLVINH